MLPSLCRLSLGPSIAGLRPKGAPDYDKPSCEAPQLNDDGEGCSCAICKDPLTEYAKNGAPWVLSTCNHQFHLLCIQRWTEIKKSCPNCRVAIPDVEATFLYWMAQVLRKDNFMILEKVPRDHAKYREIAMAAVEKDDHAFRFLSNLREDYDQIAVEMLTKNGKLLRFVDPNEPFYNEFAKAAISQTVFALHYIPPEREDYIEFALAAVATDGNALRYVNTDDDRFHEIAMAAVAQNGYALKHVPTTHKDFAHIAMAALRKTAAALQYVPRSRSDYDEIAMAAVV